MILISMQNVNICFLVLELIVENIKLILATVINAVLMTKATAIAMEKMYYHTCLRGTTRCLS